MMHDRRAHILGSLDLAGSRGLEIGPRSAPLVRKSEGDVAYVDYASTEALRAAQHDPSIVLSDIVEVDVVWGERPLAEAAGSPVDYVVASHVIEHVPDVVGWLQELRAALKPGGLLGLAIPDKRFSFDHRRPDSTIGDVLAAHLEGSRRPGIKQVVDARAYADPVDVQAVWRGSPAPKRPLARQDLTEAYWLGLELKSAPQYFDAHCWVFTPASLLETLEALHALEMFPYAIEALVPTPPGGAEFYARLRAIDPNDVATATASFEAARKAIASAPRPVEPLETELAALRAELQAVRAERDALLLSSTWRATAPLRAVLGPLRRSGRG